MVDVYDRNRCIIACNRRSSICFKVNSAALQLQRVFVDQPRNIRSCDIEIAIGKRYNTVVCADIKNISSVCLDLYVVVAVGISRVIAAENKIFSLNINRSSIKCAHVIIAVSARKIAAIHYSCEVAVFYADAVLS